MKNETTMTTLTLTRGQILDLMSLLCDKAEEVLDNDEVRLAHYYLDMHSQFLGLNTIIKNRASERQLATLALTEFTESDI